jgi:DNA-binding transcriptional MerR regulator
VASTAAKQAYSRDEVLRLLGISKRQLKSWEDQKLVSSRESFTFADILVLRMLLGLRKSKVPGAQIRKAIEAVKKKLSGMHDPLTEVKIYSQGKRIQVQFAGQKMEPISGQLLLDFDEADIRKLLSFPGQNAQTAARTPQARRQAEHWFERGLELEQTGAPMEEIIEAYRKACDSDPASAGALVNLGTVHFHAREWHEAERNYRKAIEVDPNYALAHFNLGNLYDERGEREQALNHYLAALRIHSGYADAHYNVALLYQSIGQPLKAVRHWKLYLKLDGNSPWAAIARRELARLKDSTIVRNPKKE